MRRAVYQFSGMFMIIIFALLAGVALGAGVAGLLLTLRWQKAGRRNTPKPR